YFNKFSIIKTILYEFTNLLLYSYLFNLLEKWKVTLKKSNLKFLALLLVFQIIIIPNFFIIIGQGVTLEIDPEFGEMPTIDGDISESAWDNATKNNIKLDDLDIELWVMQSNSHLYIAISFELDYLETEFLAIIISNSTSNSTSSYKDAKIIQFVNLTTGEFNYLDYKINNNLFTLDTKQDGNGAAKNITHEKYYEFSIPIDNGDDIEDVDLQFEQSYGFNISLGYTASYPSGIFKSNFIIINLRTPSPPEINPIELSLLIISIVISSITGAFIIIYSYKISTLKKKIKRFIK
ncbi:MAG: hypothetical protein ACFFAT_18245, partial [Promethearchaeota archaeon]